MAEGAPCPSLTGATNCTGIGYAWEEDMILAAKPRKDGTGLTVSTVDASSARE